MDIIDPEIEIQDNNDLYAGHEDGFADPELDKLAAEGLNPNDGFSVPDAE